MTQLRRALEENEGYFDTLQATHDELADRLAEVETEHAEMLIERSGDAHLLQEALDEICQMREVVAKRDDEKAKVERAIVDLQKQLHEAESEVERLDDLAKEHSSQYAASAAEVQRELQSTKEILQSKEERVAELEDLLRAGLERENEIRRLSVMVKTRDERILDLESRQTERQRQLDISDNTVSEKDAEIASLSFRNNELEEDKSRLEKDCRAAVQSISAKDTIIGVLRDKLGVAAFEKDELLASNQLLQAEAEMRRIEKNSTIVELHARLNRMSKEKEELEARKTDLEREMDRMKRDAETGEVTLREKEGAARACEEAVAQLKDEKAAWEEEREQVSTAMLTGRVVY